MTLKIGALLFEDFELLDVYGPLEMFGILPEHFSIHLVAENNHPLRSAQGPRAVIDDTFSDAKQYDILLVPGGQGTRTQINNRAILDWVHSQSQRAKFVTSVCTGSALLAKSGVLDGRSATSNKAAYDWATSQNKNVNWVAQARWIEDGKFFTSSGVSAGIDMSLALIKNILGMDISQKVANLTEYSWHSDPTWDPFAKLNNLI